MSLSDFLEISFPKFVRFLKMTQKIDFWGVFQIITLEALGDFSVFCQKWPKMTINGQKMRFRSNFLGSHV